MVFGLIETDRKNIFNTYYGKQITWTGDLYAEYREKDGAVQTRWTYSNYSWFFKLSVQRLRGKRDVEAGLNNNWSFLKPRKAGFSLGSNKLKRDS